MSLNTLIQWCRHTLNFWWGCVEVSEACRDCYARELDKMRGGNFDSGNTHWGKKAPRWLRVEKAVKDAEKMNRLAIKEGGERPRVFINSMSDTFEDHPALPEARKILFETIERLSACNWLLLTKRPENIMAMVPGHWTVAGCWPKNVWVGTTVENQARADERIPVLLRVPAAVRFLSCEPLLGPVEFSDVTRRADCVAQLGKPALAGIHWVICGGESGSKARPFDLAWARSMRDQCKQAGVPFFMKQMGSNPFQSPEHDGATGYEITLKDGHGGDWNEWPHDLRVREVPKSTAKSAFEE